MQQIGVLDRGDESEARLHARGFGVVGAISGSPPGRAGRSRRRWEIPGRLHARAACAKTAAGRAAMAVQQHGTTTMPLPHRRATTAPSGSSASISRPALAPAAAHSRPRPNMAPRCVLTPEVAASMAASASRPMILSRPMPQPGAPRRPKLEVRLDGCGTAAKRAGVHVVVAAAVDMAHETGLRPGLQFQEKTMDGAVAIARASRRIGPASRCAERRARSVPGRRS